MQRAFVLLGLLGLGFAAGCGGGDDEPDPLATRTGFCNVWAERACNADVVDACAASSVSTCREAQIEHCQSLVSADAYRKGGAKACLDAVRAALTDGKLDAEEAAVVLRGESACNFVCVQVGDGGCVEPTVVGGGDECGDADVVCVDTHYCDGNNCLTKRGEGKDCSDEIPCQSEFQCVEDNGVRTCQPRAGNGDACQADDDCASGICAQGAGVCVREIILSAAEPACSLFR